MQESGDLTGQGTVEIVDEGLECLRLPSYGDYIVVGHDRRNERTIAMRKVNGVTCLPDPDPTVALHAHTNDKTIVFEEITMERPRALRHPDSKVRRIDDEVRTINLVRIVGTIVVEHREVEGLGCQLSMQFAGLAVKSWAVVVIDAISDIR